MKQNDPVIQIDKTNKRKNPPNTQNKENHKMKDQKIPLSRQKSITG